MRLKTHKYESIAKIIEQQIFSGVLLPGNKLPSLRELCRIYSVSQSTAIAVYFQLEAKGYLESRPKSGYFVSHTYRKSNHLPSASRPEGKPGNTQLGELTESIFKETGPGHIRLSHGVPSAKLLPVAKLNKALVLAARNLQDGGTAYAETQGNEKLRRQIALHSYHIKALGPEDIITTAGCINAIAYGLMVLTQPGDHIAVESPVYFGTLRLARSLKLNVVELPTHPVYGIDLDDLSKVLQKKKIKAIVLTSNFSNPIGSLMPDERKKELVRLIQLHDIPLIEDDIYGDVHFGINRPSTCKSFDDSGLVLLCSSFSKTLAPGYRVGWIAPGRFKSAVLNLKLAREIASTNLTEEVIANFLETGRYEHHLKKLNKSLYSNRTSYGHAIDQYFPENTKVSDPQGGLVLWVEFEKKVDTLKLFEQALRAGISIAPGKMFSLQNQFGNCMRLNYGLEWNEALRTSFRLLGNLIKAF